MARRGSRSQWPYGPPEYDITNKPYVQRARKQQNLSRRRVPTYFSHWHDFGDYIRKNQNVKKKLNREASKILSDLKNQLRRDRSMGQMGREVAGRLFLDFEARGGWHNDRPFFHIAERSTTKRVGGKAQDVREFGLVDFRSAHSDSAWSEFLSDKAEWEAKFGAGSWPGTGQYKDAQSIRDKVVERYHQRNPDSVRYGRL